MAQHGQNYCISTNEKKKRQVKSSFQTRFQANLKTILTLIRDDLEKTLPFFCKITKFIIKICKEG